MVALIHPDDIAVKPAATDHAALMTRFWVQNPRWSNEPPLDEADIICHTCNDTGWQDRKSVDDAPSYTYCHCPEGLRHRATEILHTLDQHEREKLADLRGDLW